MLRLYYESTLKRFIASLMFILSFVIIQSVAFSSQVKAAMPYTYTLSKTDNGNIITLTFDSGMTVNSIEASQIPIKATIKVIDDDVKLIRPLRIENIVKKDSNTIAITVSDLEPTKANYEINLEPGIIKFTGYIQLITFKIQFSSNDFGYSLGDIFLTRGNEDYIDDNIYEYNKTEDINIYIPKKHISKIETSHKYEGATNSSSNNTPKITGVSVLTDNDVKKLIMNITDKDGKQLMASKTLEPRTDIKGFNFGQTDLNIKSAVEYNINIKAYDFYGKLLEQISIIPKVKDKDKDFVINDYISKASSFKSEKIIALDEALEKTSTLSSALESFGNDLNSIKVVCNNTSDYRIIKAVDDDSNDNNSDDDDEWYDEYTYYKDWDKTGELLSQLRYALNDDDVKYIRFEKALKLKLLSEGLKISGRNISIEGNGSRFKGDVIVGTGANDTNIYELKNIRIDGDLIIKKSTVGGKCNIENVKAANIIMED